MGEKYRAISAVYWREPIAAPRRRIERKARNSRSQSPYRQLAIGRQEAYWREPIADKRGVLA